ncbi:MAG: 4-alpha-glucanotransferase [bacterium]
MKRRGSGLLLHITSLPSRYGIGDMGPEACRFADFLAAAGQSLWQILPLNPTEPIHHNTPYHSISAFAGNPMLISPDVLVEEGLLEPSDLEPVPAFPAAEVAFDAVRTYKTPLLERAFERFTRRKLAADYERFCKEQAHWLDDFALFKALRTHFDGRIWTGWPRDLRDRHVESLAAARKELADRIERERFIQFVFFAQWARLRQYGSRLDLQLFGDMPIYVDLDSADLWTHPELFHLDEEKRPTVVAGVPPDYFSSTGQLWGNPIYRWDALQRTGYRWWMDRIVHNLELFDLVRIDHFIGMVTYWAVPAAEKSAINGRWCEAPADDFFRRLAKKLPYLPLVAEDLGSVTPAVREVMARFDIPGMKVLLFAFGDKMPENPYIPHNLPANSVAYTGTHDTNTVRGWFEKEATPEDKERLFRYLGRPVPPDELAWELIRLLMGSVANTVILPVQDLLGLGDEARMNRPAVREGNWKYRLEPGRLTPALSERLRKTVETYGRN